MGFGNRLLLPLHPTPVKSKNTESGSLLKSGKPFLILSRVATTPQRFCFCRPSPSPTTHRRATRNRFASYSWSPLCTSTMSSIKRKSDDLTLEPDAPGNPKKEKVEEQAPTREKNLNLEPDAPGNPKKEKVEEQAPAREIGTTALAGGIWTMDKESPPPSEKEDLIRRSYFKGRGRADPKDAESPPGPSRAERMRKLTETKFFEIDFKSEESIIFGTTKYHPKQDT